MTGFNVRVVNPGLQPLAGYWAVIEDCGRANQVWERVSWNAALTNGGRVGVWVRTGDDRMGLANEPFLQVSNNVPLVGVNGRFIEVRLALVRDQASQQPVLYDLTLHGRSTSFVDWFLDDEVVIETGDAEFWPWVVGPEPFTYQWYAWYPWSADWVILPSETNATLLLSNVDSWDHTNWFGVQVTSAAGESLFVGPALLWVAPLPITIPSSGPASRYPATVEVFGQPTNLARVEVWLELLSHNRSEDLDILLVSPSGAKIMLMSDAGGTNAVSNATLVFHPSWEGNGYPPYQDPLPSNTRWDYSCANYDGNDDTMPYPAPSGPYPSPDLDVLKYTDPCPDGIWQLFINDDRAGQTGVLERSWRLKSYYH